MVNPDGFSLKIARWLNLFLYFIVATDCSVSGSDRKLSFSSIAGFEPKSCLDDVRSFGLDVEAYLEALQSDANISRAIQIYEQGLETSSTSTLQLAEPLTESFPIGTTVIGAAVDSSAATGTLAAGSVAGDTTISVLYDLPSCFAEPSSPFQSNLQCKVGANNPSIIGGCFQESGELMLGMSANSLEYTYNIRAGTKMSTIQSAWARSVNYQTDDGALVDTYQQAVAYFGFSEFLDEFIQAARNGATFNAENGPIFFVPLSSQQRRVSLENAMMWANYVAVLGAWELAASRCDSGGDEAVRMVDSAIALYIGADNGVSLYDFANSACGLAGTCNSENIAVSNEKILQGSLIVQEAAANGDCVRVRATIRDVLIRQSIVPWIQTLKALAPQRGDSIALTRGSTLSLPVQASVFNCNLQDARIIYFFFGNLGTEAAFIDSMERSYSCLGVTCRDVGGADGPCLDDSTRPTPAPTVPPPTRNPTVMPSDSPVSPTISPTSVAPTIMPTRAPVVPTVAPISAEPTLRPTSIPTASPISSAPTTSAPTRAPTFVPTMPPSVSPTHTPTATPSTALPTTRPTLNPTLTPGTTSSPTVSPIISMADPTASPQEAGGNSSSSPEAARSVLLITMLASCCMYFVMVVL